jgi:hypothetical protein
VLWGDAIAQHPLHSQTLWLQLALSVPSLQPHPDLPSTSDSLNVALQPSTRAGIDWNDLVFLLANREPGQ